MSNQDDVREDLKLADRATLSLLSVLEDDDRPTQRSLAERIGVALGMTNSLLKRAVRKGLVKVKDAPAKRYVYYVTPKGFSEKSRLVAEYLSTSLTFFRKARSDYAEIYETLLADGHKRVALCGAGELAEIAIMSAHQCDVEICGVIESGCNLPHFAGVHVYSSIEASLEDKIDAVVITAAVYPQDTYDQVVRHVDPERVYTVPLLHISRKKRGEG